MRLNQSRNWISFFVLFGALRLMPPPVDVFVLRLGEGPPQDRFKAMEPR
jgi:hypothetical protein